MMDDKVQPGDGHKRHMCCRILLLVLCVIGLILIWPFFVVFYFPIGCTVGAAITGYKECNSVCCAVCFGICGLILGLVLNTLVMPSLIVGTIVGLGYLLVKAIGWCVMGCKNTSAEAAEANRKTAEQNMENKKKVQERKEKVWGQK